MIYILDDDKNMLYLYERRLREEGILDFKTFTDEEKLIEEIRVKGKLPIVIVIDHVLATGKTGVDVMREILDCNPFCYPIIVSGQYNFDVAIEYINHDCFRYVKKNDRHWMDKSIEFIKVALQRIKEIKEYFNGQNE